MSAYALGRCRAALQHMPLSPQTATRTLSSASTASGSGSTARGKQQALRAKLDYQRVPAPSTDGIDTRIGRYIFRNPRQTDPTTGLPAAMPIDYHDVHEGVEVEIRDARDPAAADNEKHTLTTSGFQLAGHRLSTPSGATGTEAGGDIDFHDDEQVRTRYYPAIETLIKRVYEGEQAAESNLAVDRVLVFDHTLRTSEQAKSVGMNAAPVGAPQARGGTAAESGGESNFASAVARVHCDYTAVSAPRRLTQLLPSSSSETRMRSYTGADLAFTDSVSKQQYTGAQLLSDPRRRVAFVNVWRSIDTENPVLARPLAVCDARSVQARELLTYELNFVDDAVPRVGENYSLPAAAAHHPAHQWYFYPRMTADEALLFTVYDRRHAAVAENSSSSSTDPARGFVFHTSFESPEEAQARANGDARAVPPRKSIEIRAIVVFRDPMDIDVPPATAN